MNVRTQFNPPASNTAPDSRVQINSNTYNKTKFNLNEVHTKIGYLYPQSDIYIHLQNWLRNETTGKKKNLSLPQHPEEAKASSTLVVSSYSFLQKCGSQYENISQRDGHNRCSRRQITISHPGRNTQLRVLKLVRAPLPQ